MANTTPANASAPAKASGSSDAPSVTDLATQAHNEVSQQISRETSGYESDIAGAQGGMERGLAGIGKMFGDLMPYAQNAAKFVGDYYDASLAREQNIYEQAQGRLSMIRAQRAAEAQQFAQQTGGPVNVEAFLAPLNTSMVELPNAQQNTLFHSNMLAQGGVQEAEAWAGRVFPMIRVEQEQQLRAEFQARINAAQKEIDRIKAEASTREQTRLEELQQQEREYKLEQARLALDRLKADRDYRATQQQLKNQQRQLADDRAGILGYYEGRYRGKDGKIHTWRKPTWATTQDKTKLDQAQQSIDEDVRSHKASEDLTQQDITSKKVDADRAYAFNKQKLRVEQARYVGQLIKEATTPGSQTYKRTRYVLSAGPGKAATMTSAQKAKLIPMQLSKAEAVQQTGNPNAAPGVYYFSKQDETVPVSDTVIQDPTQLYKYLVQNGADKTMALNAVRAKYQISGKWKPGMGYDPADKVSMDKINGMDFNEVRALAKKEGWQPDPKKKATAYTLKTWLYHHFGYAVSDKQHPPEDVGTKVKSTGSAGSYKNFIKNHPGVKWDPKHKYWISPGGTVMLQGHPPDRSGNPT